MTRAGEWFRQKWTRRAAHVAGAYRHFALAEGRGVLLDLARFCWLGGGLVQKDSQGRVDPVATACRAAQLEVLLHITRSAGMTADEHLKLLQEVQDHER